MKTFYFIFNILRACRGGGLNFLLILFILIVSPQIIFPQLTFKTINYKGQEAKIVSNEICIKIKKGENINSLKGLVSSYNAVIKEKVDILRWTTIKFPNQIKVENVIDQFSKNPAIECAEFNFVGEAHTIPNDPLFNTQWALRNTGQMSGGGTIGADINIVDAWNITTGSSNVVLAILDSGIPMNKPNFTLSHPDLDDPAKIIIGPDVTADGDSVRDSTGHGTHVAGIAGAESNNGTGITGVCWSCKLLIVQAFHRSIVPDSTTASFFRNAVVWVVNWKQNNPSYKVVINYSGGIKIPTQQMEDAVQYANDLGVLIVASSGNNDLKPHYPARFSLNYSNVIVVGATDHYDNITVYSITGSHINVVAPGGTTYPTVESSILSTTPNYPFGNNSETQNYGYMMGTSMAAPHVTGLAGLILSLEDYEPNLIREIIQKNAKDLGSANFDTVYGWGRIRAAKTIQSVNNRPRNLTVSNFNQNPRLSWDAVPNAIGYGIYKGVVSNMNTVYNYLNEVDATTTYYVDTAETINPYQPIDKMVAYRVTAVVNEESAKSNKAQIRVNGGALEKRLVNYSYELKQNYPNPFNPITKIKYSIADDGPVQLKLFDLLGREIYTITDDFLLKGEYEVELNLSNFSSGMYLYKLQSGKFIETKKLILLK
jgi:subtilisin family serine protease